MSRRAVKDSGQYRLPMKPRPASSSWSGRGAGRHAMRGRGRGRGWGVGGDGDGGVGAGAGGQQAPCAAVRACQCVDTACTHLEVLTSLAWCMLLLQVFLSPPPPPPPPPWTACTAPTPHAKRPAGGEGGGQQVRRGHGGPCRPRRRDELISGWLVGRLDTHIIMSAKPKSLLDAKPWTGYLPD